MKTTITKIIALVFLSTLTTSCIVDGFNKINGNRKVVTENRKLNDDFTKIKTGNGIDVFITQASKVALTVEADENLQDIIKTEVTNGVLKVYADKNIWRAKAKKVYITVNSLEGITASSGSDVVTENTIVSDVFEAKTSSGADLKLRIKTNELTSSSSSGSDLRILGTANKYNASASSGSSTRAYDLDSKNAIVSASSGADIDVQATKSIDAKASSGGDIDYKGSPEMVNKKSSSGGSISAY